MIGIGVRSNVPLIMARLKIIKARLPWEFQQTMKTAGAIVSRAVKIRTPVVTSSLRKSIRSKQEGLLTFVIRSRNVDGLGTGPEKYVNAQEHGPLGRTKRASTKNRNKRARRRGDGGYHMFEQNERFAQRTVRHRGILLANRTARKI